MQTPTHTQKHTQLLWKISAQDQRFFTRSWFYSVTVTKPPSVCMRDLTGPQSELSWETKLLTRNMRLTLWGETVREQPADVCILLLQNRNSLVAWLHMYSDDLLVLQVPVTNGSWTPVGMRDGVETTWGGVCLNITERTERDLKNECICTAREREQEETVSGVSGGQGQSIDTAGACTSHAAFTTTVSD